MTLRTSDFATLLNKEMNLRVPSRREFKELSEY
jgi:hypothetical protein